MRVIPPADLTPPRPVETIIGRKLLAVGMNQMAEELVLPERGSADVSDLRMFRDAGFSDVGHGDTASPLLRQLDE